MGNGFGALGLVPRIILYAGMDGDDSDMFILDSGAYTSIVREGYADKYGIKKNRLKDVMVLEPVGGGELMKTDISATFKCRYQMIDKLVQTEITAWVIPDDRVTNPAVNGYIALGDWDKIGLGPVQKSLMKLRVNHEGDQKPVLVKPKILMKESELIEAQPRHPLYVYQLAGGVDVSGVSAEAKEAKRRDKLLDTTDVERAALQYNETVRRLNEMESLRVERVELPIDSDEAEGKRQALQSEFPNELSIDTEPRGGQCIVKPPEGLRTRVDMKTFDLKTLKCHPYRTNAYDRKVVRRYTDSELDTIRSIHSTAPVAAPVFNAGGRDKDRVVIGFDRTVNRLFFEPAYPSPAIKKDIMRMQGYKVFWILDYKSFFDQCQFPEEFLWTQSYVTEDGQFQKVGCGQGHSCSPGIAQRVSDIVIGPILDRLRGNKRTSHWDPYNKTDLSFLDGIDADLFTLVDDTVCGAATLEGSYQVARALCMRMKELGLITQMKKARLFYRRLFALGFVIEAGILRPDPSRVLSVLDLPKPTSKKELTHFVCFALHYQSMLPRMLESLKPLHHAATTDKKFVWDETKNKQYDMVKEDIENSAVRIYDDNFMNILKVDFREGDRIQMDGREIKLPNGIAVVFCQGRWKEEMVGGRLRITLLECWPVAFYAKELKGAEGNYTHNEGEVWVMMAGLKHFFDFVWGRRNLILSDSDQAVARVMRGGAVSPIQKGGFSMSPRMRKILSYIAQFEIVIAHIPAKVGIEADFWSRVKVDTSHLPSYAEDVKEIEVAGEVHGIASTEGEVMEEEVDVGPINFVIMGRDTAMPKARSRSEVLAELNQKQGQVPKVEDKKEGINGEIAAFGEARMFDQPFKHPEIDPYKEPYFGYLTEGVTVEDKVKKEMKGYSIDGQGRIVYKSYYYVPPPHERLMMVRRCHGIGHETGENLRSRIRNRGVDWKSLKVYTDHVESECIGCPRGSGKGTAPVQHISKGYTETYQPGHTVASDFVTIGASTGTEKTLCVVYCLGSKVVVLTPADTESGETVVRGLKAWHSRYGPFETLISDRGPGYDSARAWAFCAEHGVSRIFSTGGYSKGNSMAERINREIEELIRAAGYGKLWMNHLDEITYGLNTRPSNGSLTPIQVLLPHLRTGFVAKLVTLDPIIVKASDCSAKEGTTRYLRKGVELEIGDVTFVKRKERTGNIDDYYDGPYLVDSLHGENKQSVQLATPDGTKLPRRFVPGQLVRSKMTKEQALSVWQRENGIVEGSDGVKTKVSTQQRRVTGLERKAKAMATRKISAEFTSGGTLAAYSMQTLQDNRKWTGDIHFQEEGEIPPLRIMCSVGMRFSGQNLPEGMGKEDADYYQWADVDKEGTLTLGWGWLYYEVLDLMKEMGQGLMNDIAKEVELDTIRYTCDLSQMRSRFKYSFSRRGGFITQINIVLREDEAKRCEDTGQLLVENLYVRLIIKSILNTNENGPEGYDLLWECQGWEGEQWKRPDTVFMATSVFGVQIQVNVGIMDTIPKGLANKLVAIGDNKDSK